MNSYAIGNKYLGIVLIKDEDKLLTLSVYPIRLTLEFYDNERLQIRLNIFKLGFGIFLVV